MGSVGDVNNDSEPTPVRIDKANSVIKSRAVSSQRYDPTGGNNICTASENGATPALF